MKSAYKWKTVSEDGHWVSYCITHDLPKIIKLKNDKFKVEAGKQSRIEETWDDAVKYAISYGKKMAKAVKKWEKENE